MTIETLADIPDGMTVTAITDPDQGDALAFYTGRWTIQYDVTEVKRLVRSLNAWLATKQPAPAKAP